MAVPEGINAWGVKSLGNLASFTFADSRTHGSARGHSIPSASVPCGRAPELPGNTGSICGTAVCTVVCGNPIDSIVMLGWPNIGGPPMLKEGCIGWC